MRKLFSILFCVFLISVSAFASPFGFSKGMSFEQVKEACGGREPVKIDDGLYYIVPVKQHPYFIRYIAWIDEKEGLNYIKAIGKDINTNGYGFELKSKFDSLETSLSKTYGKCDRTDFLMPGSIWDDLDDWMYALEKKERYLLSGWQRKYGSTLPDELESVGLIAMANSSYSGCIVLEYEFTNHEAINKAQQDENDSVF